MISLFSEFTTTSFLERVKIKTNKIKIINETIPNFVPINKNSLTEKL